MNYCFLQSRQFCWRISLEHVSDSCSFYFLLQSDCLSFHSIFLAGMRLIELLVRSHLTMLVLQHPLLTSRKATVFRSISATCYLCFLCPLQSRCKICRMRYSSRSLGPLQVRADVSTMLWENGHAVAFCKSISLHPCTQLRDSLKESNHSTAIFL